jgi:hypothetical protein
MVKAKLRQLLTEVISNFHSNLANIGFQEALSDNVDKLQEVEKQKTAGQRLRSLLKWRQVGDKPSKEFYKVTRAHSKASHLTKLEDVVGGVCTYQIGMVEIYG